MNGKATLGKHGNETNMTTQRAVEIGERVERFVREVVIPYERDPRRDHHGAPLDELVQEMRDHARTAGVLTPHVLPDGGHLTQLETAYVLQKSGLSPLGPLAVNTMAPDEGNMYLLGKVGSPEIKERFLKPLVEGRARSAFFMTEPALEGGAAESVKPGDPRLARAEVRIVATPEMALEAAASVARDAGYAPFILGDAIEGEARDVGKVLAGIALQVADKGQPFERPCALLSGGETTVTLRGQGRGGRNVECLLSFAMATQGHPRIHALMGDTDGVDGVEEIAGASIGPHTLQHAYAKGLHPRHSLDHNDGHGFFSSLGASIVTGPTLTNVNDFRVILINP